MVILRMDRVFFSPFYNLHITRDTKGKMLVDGEVLPRQPSNPVTSSYK